MAEAEYDPAERRERYLRNEQKLKGRQSGSGETTSWSSGSRGSAPVPNKQASRAAAAKRVAALNGKLTQLREALKKARAQAPKPDPNAGKSESESKAAKKKADEEYYNKNKNEIKNDRKAEARKSGSSSGGSKSTGSSDSAAPARSVEEIESAIHNTLKELKAAIAKLKSL